ncbi:serine/threonine protein kinase [Exiguobacterium aurantiacum]|uniref:Serine/threonine protein kinase n=1 Tax=Exiguobacterium aurantiacum TaxID=33987 RepID=A0A377FQQ9_9BACL|nr:serine/threonine protein kinase [Exiguobacterium aurantiacum]STO06894.1 serine/threonine protein kinase [Exiguobacterium aurantiacum]
MNRYDLLADVSFDQSGEETRVMHMHESLELHGIGRSAAVFRINGTRLVIKVFFPGFTHIAAEEAVVYETLEPLPQFPRLYEVGPNYIVIDYIEGKTLFECLTEGIWIDAAYVDDVDAALSAARRRGLTPSDVHLRNIILSSDGRIFLIDLARFRQGQQIDHQWEDLKRMYRIYRLRFVPKRYSERLLNAVAFWYRTVVFLLRIREQQ